MAKKILVLSSSPRKGGNSDCLCDEFINGAKDAGNTAEKIFLADKKINYCKGCGCCYNLAKPCPQNDDVAEIVEKMIEADVIVLATPVYFYSLSAQMKTLIDRCCARYTEIQNKDFYFIATAADEEEQALERTADALRGFTDCLDGVNEKGVILAAGVWQTGEIKNTKYVKQAYTLGLHV